MQLKSHNLFSALFVLVGSTSAIVVASRYSIPGYRVFNRKQLDILKYPSSLKQEVKSL